MLDRLLPRRTAAGDVLRRVKHRRAAGPPADPATQPIEAVIEAFGATHPRASFVQIGSNDGVRFDPICSQIRTRPWQGVMVEPLPWLFARLEANFGGFRRLRLENAAIAEQDGTQVLHHLAPHHGDLGDLPPWYDAIGSFRREVVLSHRDAIPDIEERLRTTEVRCLTFESLCRAHDVRRIDLVHVDTEGYDRHVLDQVDLERWAPAVVLFEHLHLDHVDRAHCVERLAEHGYQTGAGPMDTLAVRRAALDAHPAVAAAWALARPNLTI